MKKEYIKSIVVAFISLLVPRKKHESFKYSKGIPNGGIIQKSTRHDYKLIEGEWIEITN